MRQQPNDYVITTKQECKSLNVKILFKPESLKQDNITETVIIKFHLLFFYYDKPLKSHFHECLMMIII